MSEINSSLIVRLPNWVGDVIMALPALQALQSIGIELHLFGKPWAKNLLAGTDFQVHGLENSIKNMAKINSNKALLLTNSFSSAFLSRLAGKDTIGYKAHGRQLFLKLHPNIVPGLHEVDYLWTIARLAAQYWFPHLQWPEPIPRKLQLPLSSSSLVNSNQALAHAGIQQPYWVLCPFAHGTGKQGQSKIWPHWRDLSKQLQSHQLVVCPGKNEESMCADLVPEAIVLSGLNLSDYAAVLAQAEHVIANDSGPMHLAAAVGADTLGLFGVSDPNRTSPWGAQWLGTQGDWPTLSEVLNYLKQPSLK